MVQAKKFSFLDIMNSSAKSDEVSTDFKEIFLSPYEVKPTESNFYSQENIEELADAFLTVGQQQPTVLAYTNDEYKIISGHRRNAANILNIERGELNRDAKIRYLYKEMTPAILELSLIMGNALNRKLTPYEEMEQAKRLKAALIRAKEEDGLELKGKIRDIIAELLATSPTQIARMEKISSSLTDEAKEQFKAGNMGITAAYETAKLQPEEQKAVASSAAAGEEVKPKDIAERVKELQQTAIDNVEKQIDKAVKKAEYATVRVLQATVEAERVAETAMFSKEVSETDTIKPEYKITHKLKIYPEQFEAVRRGIKTFEYRLNDRGYKNGDILRLFEYSPKEEESTGQFIDVKVIYLLEGGNFGIPENYVIMSIKEV
ncbi:ParB family chromosome partitioning protein [Ruminiclostridium sufflavum DSM 19573]|uniref:ParB family chromosome partitioning protein n=1 Tax=Ruminiclostridium sufflavum DSM 19573 TaxID=1121337 RepID=A0A318XNS5_9FIRM|nr:DUF3850 domain-containing protein [Ruminiclostridium sufflavum]PYG88486.1 ParB family chromosome partitioning protein [Ruminiclostridium sufflavum DSM 19573]